jgi:hypothetical protein
MLARMGSRQPSQRASTCCPGSESGNLPLRDEEAQAAARVRQQAGDRCSCRHPFAWQVIRVGHLAVIWRGDRLAFEQPALLRGDGCGRVEVGRSAAHLIVAAKRNPQTGQLLPQRFPLRGVAVTRRPGFVEPRLRDEMLSFQRFLLAELRLRELQGGVGRAQLCLDGGNLRRAVRLAEVVQPGPGSAAARFGFGQRLRIGIAGDRKDRLTFLDTRAAGAVEGFQIARQRRRQIKKFALDVALEGGWSRLVAAAQSGQQSGGEQDGISRWVHALPFYGANDQGGGQSGLAPATGGRSLAIACGAISAAHRNTFRRATAAADWTGVADSQCLGSVAGAAEAVRSRTFASTLMVSTCLSLPSTCSVSGTVSPFFSGCFRLISITW